MSIPASAAVFISPSELAARLEHGGPMTLLDIRDAAEWTIEAPGARTLHVPTAELRADATAVAHGLDGPGAGICNRGITAGDVGPQLRALGVDAFIVEGGMSGWIATLRAQAVCLGVDGLVVRQVQRP